MYNLGDDNELDRASREAAGRYAPPSDPDWPALSSELDKVLPVEKKRRTLFFWWLLPVLLIGGGATYWLVQKDDSSIVTTVKEPAVTQTVKEADKKETKTVSPSVTVTNAQKETTTSVTVNIEKQTPVAEINKQAERTPIAKVKINAPGNESLTVNAPKNQTASVPANDKAVTKQDASKAVDQPAKENQAVTSAVQKTEDVPAKDIPKGNTDQPVKQNDITSVTENKTQPSNETAPKTETAEQPAVTKTKVENAGRGKGFSFGILAGVDKSTVKFRYSGDAGVNVGFMAGYHFSDRWSIHSGLIYTQKNYKVAGEDFTAPKGSWASYYKIDNVEGYCRMWEVPLVARYTVSQSNKHSFFLSTGLSSYFMTGENYDYTYYTNTGLLALRNTAYVSTDTHVMSILHLSAGLENRISKNWSLQIEPYAKIPLGGVGFGNIRLSSFGLNFSVQHRQPSKK
ncbi:MAG: outer membrane beta-barrel protein [Bacteroidota bacterium]